MQSEEAISRECSVCFSWSERGEFIQSGPRNQATGLIPCDNWICARCQKEAADLRAAEEALKAREKYQPAT